MTILKSIFHRLSAQTRGAPAPDKDEPMSDASHFLPDLAVDPIRPRTAPRRAALARHPNLCARPDVSVVLGTLNRMELLKPAIESVRRSLAGLNGEIIVVDGGSSDGTRVWLCEQDDIITIIQKNRFENAGQSLRRRSWGGFMNMGFRAASAEAVAMISDDCLLLESCLKAGLERIEQARASGLNVGACAFYFRNWPEEDRYYVQRTIGGNLLVNHGIYTRAALAAAGYANEDDYVFYKADTDLSMKIWESGFVIVDSPQSICEHYIGIGEALRSGNNALIEYDRCQMRAMWPELVTDEGVSKIGKIFLDRQPGMEADAEWRLQYERERLNQTGPSASAKT
jgi:GT2 family glycosyltransferase